MNDKYRILLVDDSESDRGIYRRYLLADRDFDYQIIEAETLEKGLELWRSQSPDLVLVDLNLPDGSGLELLMAIKKIYPRQKFPIIMMTGQGDERLAVQAMKLGASDYLVKDDITASTLCHYIETAIEQRNLSGKLTRLRQFNQEREIQVKQQTFSQQTSERTNRTILETIPDLLLHLRSDGTILEQIQSKRSNPNNFLPISSNISEILPPDLLIKQLQVIQQAIATKELQVYEHQFLKNHCISYEEIRVQSLNDQEVLVIVRDISDRKQAEEKLRKTTDRLAISLKSGAIGSWEWDLVNNIGLWDERMYELYGIDKKSNSLSECEILATALHPDDRNSVETLLQQAILGEAEYDTEFRIVHSDSSIHFIKCYGVVVRDDQGNPQSMIGVNFDISDRKQAEAEGKEFNRRWRSALDKIQMIVIQLDLDGNVQYINPFFLKISGFSPEEVIGKHWITHFVSSEHQLSLETIFQEILEEINNEYYVNSILTKSGEERIISWHNSVLKDKQGQSMGVISIGEDITEKHRLEQIKSEFLSIVSHELKTPLTTIQASLSLLSEKIIDPASEDGEMIITLATDGVDRLVRLVNDIFDAERLQSGTFQIKKSDCHTQKIMTDAIAQVQELAKQANIKIHLSPNSYSLHADSDRLVQVLINLLGNAIKFSPPSSTIDVSVEQQTSYLLFTVRDRGRGIPSHKLEIIFERFKQIDSSDVRDKEGAGLGLAISKEIVEQHGGKIWVESSVGKGSNFYFTLAHLRDY